MAAPPNNAALWKLAYDRLSDKKKKAIDAALPAGRSSSVTPDDVLKDLTAVTRSLAQKELIIKLPNGEKFFVQRALEKTAGYIKKFVEVGDTMVQYDPGHAAIPWAGLRFILQATISSGEQRAAITEGVEEVSYFLAWSKIEERQLMLSYDNHAQLEEYFVDLYTQMLNFMARAARTLQSKPRHVITAISDGKSRFREYLDAMALCRTHIESLTRQIMNKVVHDHSSESKQTRKLIEDVLKDTKKFDVDIQDVLTTANSISTNTTQLSADVQVVNTNVKLVLAQNEKIKTSVENLESITQGVQQLAVTSVAMQQRNEQRPILDWISSIPYQKHLDLAEKKILPGTGEWLLADPIFRSWKRSSRSQLLCLLGGAGTGKSTLLSLVLRSLITAQHASQAPYPAYFFCSRDTAERQRADPEAILRSILRQLSSLPGGPTLHPDVEDRYEQERTAGEISSDEAIGLITKIISNHATVYIVIDALDECDKDTRHILIDALSRILEDAASQVKIFLTSRDTQIDINHAMHDYPAVYIDAAQNLADIDLYIEHSVAQAITKKRFLPGTRISPELRTKIETSLKDGASGMFRWVEMQIAFLQTIRKPSAFETRLGQLPPTLHKIYDDIYTRSMNDMIAEEARVLRRTLLWLLVAQRSLKTQELRELVCMPETNDLTNETLLELCFDLVRLDRGTDQFRFAHLSVREFLELHPDFENRKIQNEALLTCLDVLDTRSQNTWDSYVAGYWLPHARAATESGLDDTMDRRLSLLLEGPSAAYIAWNNALVRMREGVDWAAIHNIMLWDVRDVLNDKASAVLSVAQFDLRAHVTRVLSSSEELDVYSKFVTTEDGDAYNVLTLAAYAGEAEILGLLLQQSVYLDPYHSSKIAALQKAVMWERPEITHKLLDHINRLYTQNYDFLDDPPSASDFIASCCLTVLNPEDGYLSGLEWDCAMVLLRIWASFGTALDDPNAAQSYKFMARAVAASQFECPELMLTLGWTPIRALLDVAIREEDEQYSGFVLKCALEHADSNYSPDLLLAETIDAQCYVELVDICLRHGANANLRTSSGESVLEAAMRITGHKHMKNVVRVLLEHGAILDTCHAGLARVLTIAVMHADLKLLGLLLRHGDHADTALDYSRCSDWHCCLDVENFVHGCGPNLHGEDRMPRILHAAVIKGHGDIVDLLLKENANANVVLGDGRSLIDIATLLGNEKIIRSLRLHGASETPGFGLSIVEAGQASFLLH